MTSTITDRLYGESSGVAVKAPCVSVSNGIPLPLVGLTAVGGYTPNAGDRILVKDQADPTTNGIYNASTGAWKRSGDFDGPYDCTQGTLVVVYFPNANGTIYQLTTFNPIIGTTPLNFSSFVNPNLIYPQTAAEATAGVVPVNYALAPGNVPRYGTNAVPGTTDMAAAFQAAINSNNVVVIPDGTYKIGSLVTLQQNTALIGVNRATVIINGPANAYTFQYLSPLDSGAPFVGQRIEGFTLNAKYGIQINQSGNPAHYGSLFGSFPADPFVTERSLVMIVFRNLILTGTYPSAGDPNMDTNLYPTSGTITPPAPVSVGGGAQYPTDLVNYGVGIFMAKCFDSLIEDTCTITQFGIGVMIDGSDVNNIKGRYQNNARHVHILSHDTYGFSNKIEGRDILANRRRGGIFIDSAVDTTIEGNYFETFLSLVSTPGKDPAGTYIATVGDQNTKILYNRCDQNRIGFAAGSPEMDLSPVYGMVISGNDATYDSVNPGVQFMIRSTYWVPSSAGAIGAAGTTTYLAKFTGNSISIPPPVWNLATGLSFPVCPHVELDTNNPRLFNVQNPKALGNTGAATFPYKISGATGRVVINTANTPLNVIFASTPDDLDLLLRFAARWVSGAGSVVITWGGVVVFNNTLGYTNATAPVNLSEVDITIRRPDSVLGIQPIVIDLLDGTVEYESIQIIPVAYQKLGAAPAGAVSTYRVGDITYNAGPVAAGTAFWMCTAAGAPGTWSPVSMP